MAEPIVFVRQMPVAITVLTDAKQYALAAGQLLLLMESDIKLRAEGRRYTVIASRLAIGDTSDMFIRNMLEAELRLTVTFTE